MKEMKADEKEINEMIKKDFDWGIISIKPLNIEHELPFVPVSSSPNINFYSKEQISIDKFKNVAKRLKDYMKSKNISEIGLFKKFDKNNDGFISCIDFNSTIGSIIPLFPSMRNQFFNYLDF